MFESSIQRKTAHSIVTALNGSWRFDAPAPPFTAAELAEITPLLIQSGAGALVWWRIRNDELAKSDAGVQLHQSYRLHRLEASLHVDRLKRVMQKLRDAGIEPVLVKGWNVARLYPEPGLRHYFDVDLCVQHDCYAEAQELVLSFGEESLYVDLHDELDHLDVMTWEAFFAGSQVLRVDGTDVRVPRAEDHLRLLCLHWLRHGAWKPAGLCDIAAALESRPNDFDWQRCLGDDPLRADWVACATGLAQQLLGAEIRHLRSQFDATSAETAERLRTRIERLPRWLVPAVLRKWGQGVSPNYHVPVSALLSGDRGRRKLAENLVARLDQPVRATIALHGRFNDWPRLPYQLGELFLHRLDKFQNSWNRWFAASQHHMGLRIPPG